MSLPERIESKIDRSGECHIWQGPKKANGYGQVYFEGKMRLIHRVVYELEIGPIPPDMTIDHVATRGCTSKACVRLDHLEVVTRRENILRGNGPSARCARKTHCPRGHPYDAVDSRGKRYCRECARASWRANWRKRRARGLLR